jgi:hypothetical protein
MIVRKFALLLLLGFSPINITLADNGGFDEVCKIYTEALNSNMSGDQLNTFILDNVKTRIKNKDAKSTHDAIPFANPEERYKIFKDSAEHYLKKKWDCAAMKTLMK